MLTRRWLYALAFRLARRCLIDVEPTPPLRWPAVGWDALQGLGRAGERSAPLPGASPSGERPDRAHG